jgi:hypothetical protein
VIKSRIHPSLHIIVVKSKTHPSIHIIVVKSKTHPSMHIIVLKSKTHPSMHIIVLKSKARYTRCKFCIQVSIQVSWIQVFWSCIPYKKLESKTLNGLGWNRNASYFFSTWMEPGWRLTNQKTESLSASICECK